MCLHCHDPVIQRVSAALHIFQNSRKAVDQFTHADLVQLFKAGLILYAIENTFEYTEEESEENELGSHIQIKRRLSQDDSSLYSVYFCFSSSLNLFFESLL